MRNILGSDPTLTNCILWGNAPDQIANSTSGPGATPVIAFSDIGGSGGSGLGWDSDLGTDAGGNIDADPLFVDADGADDNAGTADDDLRLQARLAVPGSG